MFEQAGEIAVGEESGEAARFVDGHDGPCAAAGALVRDEGLAHGEFLRGDAQLLAPPHQIADGTEPAPQGPGGMNLGEVFA